MTRLVWPLALAALNAACGQGKASAPTAAWAHTEANWDRAKWEAACSPGRGPRVGTVHLSWTQSRRDDKFISLVSCGVAFDSGRPVSVDVRIKAAPAEIPALLARPLDMLLTEVPSDVATVARRLASSRRRAFQSVGAFDILVDYQNDLDMDHFVDDQPAVDFMIDISSPSAR